MLVMLVAKFNKFVRIKIVALSIEGPMKNYKYMSKIKYEWLNSTTLANIVLPTYLHYELLVSTFDYSFSIFKLGRISE